MNKKSVKEKRNDIYNANRFSLRCIWLAIIAFSIAGICNLLHIFIVDQNIMNMASLGMVILLFLSYIVKWTIGFDHEISGYIIMLILVAMITFANIEISYHATLFLLFPMVCSVLYHNKRFSVYTFVLSTVSLFVSVLGSFYWGLCDANMLLLTYTTTQNHAKELMEHVPTLNSSPILVILFFFLPRFVALIAFFSLQNYITNDIQEKTRHEVESRRLAETDGLTGLYNRTKYEEMSDDFYSTCESVAAMYVDVNNLKKINDHLGHEYGDELIIGMASILKEFEDDNIKAYRMGGDEFVLIFAKATEGEVIETQKLVDVAIQNAKLKYDLKLSAATGISYGKGTEIKYVIKKADENMYANKAAMKKKMSEA